MGNVGMSPTRRQLDLDGVEFCLEETRDTRDSWKKQSHKKHLRQIVGVN